jgi:hypothetical protein
MGRGCNVSSYLLEQNDVPVPFKDVLNLFSSNRILQRVRDETTFYGAAMNYYCALRLI